ncbi:hypothetical protein [Paenibacillus silvisoli]|uniref:hypothetical protein n=1 Tax=Paenibacillus silvisoli TaxID=3110539 RepID=UPI002805FB69|nr:hypothetical protein [Paenibacillus silvisoli]
MKRTIAFCSAVIFIFAWLAGCTNDKIAYIHIYEMESFQKPKPDSLQVITYTSDIALFSSAIKGAKRNAGIADMADPQYKVDIGEEAYFLWLTEQAGTIENVKDTHTTYSLSKESAKDIFRLLSK